MQYLKIIILLMFGLPISSCDSGPKVIEEDISASTNKGGMSPIFKDVPKTKSPSISDEHKVVVEEVLNTEKYSYLNVSENGENFWIAVMKMDAKPGDIYYYKGGLIKKNFYSKEYDRTFETVYLVSNIRKQPVAPDKNSAGGSAIDEALSKIKGNTVVTDSPINVSPAEGAIKLSELFSNKEKYEGKTVKITGKIVKINPMIMGRNWVHIQDGSGDKLDLTVTTTENIPLGHVVTLEGTIALNKDFGAGYRYDIIMEGAVLK
ncbi:MAG TPA: hypothetical protein ENJ95_21880 [Bacteroidetes bacterium]|nr:hypothetical protein [Bacteroidota bacterium]